MPDIAELEELYRRPETRQRACGQLKQLDQQGRNAVLGLLRKRRNGAVGQQCAFMALVGSLAFCFALLYVENIISHSECIGGIGVSIAVAVGLGLVFSKRLAAPLETARGMVCELDGAEVVIPVLDWLSMPNSPFPAWTTAGDAANACVARNLHYLKGNEGALGRRRQINLTNSACILARSGGTEPWKYDFVHAVLDLAPAFDNANAMARIQRAAGGLNE